MLTGPSTRSYPKPPEISSHPRIHFLHFASHLFLIFAFLFRRADLFISENFFKEKGSIYAPIFFSWFFVKRHNSVTELIRCCEAVKLNRKAWRVFYWCRICHYGFFCRHTKPNTESVLNFGNKYGVLCRETRLV